MAISEIEKLKKEVTDLESRRIRAQKEEKDAFEEKYRHLKDIDSMKKNTERLRIVEKEVLGKIAKLNSELLDLKKIVVEKKQEVARLEQLAKKEDERALIAQGEIEKGLENIKKLKQAVLIDSKNAKALLDAANLKSKEISEKHKQIASEQVDLNDAIVSAKKKEAAAHKMLENAQVTIDEANKLKEMLNEKIDSYKQMQKELADRIEILKSKEKSIDTKNEELSLEFVKVNAKAIELDKKSKAMERALVDVDKMKDEVRIKELRVNKVIRDKGLAEELKQLEESLK